MLLIKIYAMNSKTLLNRDIETCISEAVKYGNTFFSFLEVGLMLFFFILATKFHNLNKAK